MREIPKRNYFLLLFIVVGIVFGTIYLSHLYNENKESTFISPMYEFLPSITTEEVMEVVTHRPLIVIYISDMTNEDIYELELELKEMIISLEIQEFFVYLDSSEHSESILEFFHQEFDIEFNIHDTQTLIVVQDGAVLGLSTNKPIAPLSIELFLRNMGVIENIEDSGL